MNKFHYNFVFYYVRDDYLKQAIGLELLTHPQVRIYKEAFRGPYFLQKLYHLHTSYSLNSKINIPFKFIWFRRMYKQNFNNNMPICFIYIGGNMIRFDGGFTEYVKKRNSRNRVVMLHLDLISKNVNYDYNTIKDKVDLAITYDKEEARKYGIHYFQETTYSKPIIAMENPAFKQDVYFLGMAKDRLEEIYAVYQYLTIRGVKCKFLIAGVPEEKRISGKGLEYISRISYDENVRNVIESKCVLEVVQGGSSDITLRVKEAIAYERRLISNCPADLKEFFNPNQLIQFDEVSDIDTKLAKASLPAEGFPPKMDMNPLKRLYDIQEQLEKLDG